jgi:ATP-binding cassette subfamily C protein
MKNNLFIIKSFRLLFQYHPWKLGLLFLLTLFLGINQGFSIILLIPLLQILDIGEIDNSNHLVRFLDSLFDKTGIVRSIEVVLLTFVVLLVIIALLQYLKSIFQSAYQEGFSYQIRRRLFKKIILSDWNVLNSKSKHNHLQVLAEEVPKLTDYYYFYLQMITRLIIAAAHLFFAFMISVKFTGLVLLAGLLSFVFLRKYLSKAFQLGSGYVSAFNRLLKYIDDFWMTVKMAKVHNSEAFYYQKFDSANVSMLQLQYKLLKNWALPQLFFRVAGILILVAVIYSGYRIGHVPLASLFILIVLFGRIFPQFVSFNNDLNYIYSNIASVDLVLKLDEQFEERPFPQSSTGEALNIDKEIRIDQLHFGYPGSEPLFTAYNERFPAKKITAIAGDSGIGKTTLIDLISGLQKPDSGQILVDDKPLNDDLLPLWKSTIGYLPQDSFFIDGTIRENLVWDSREELTDDDIWEVLEKVNAGALIKRQKQQLDTMVANWQYYFSGGERQRLALARVLLRNPKLLILDEATSSLDPENEKQVMEVLSRLKHNITILFVTHRESVLPYCDEVVRVGSA